MTHLSKLKLNRFVKADLSKREMNDTKGGGDGDCCFCACRYWDQGYSTLDNSGANNAGGLSSGGGYGTGFFF